MGIDIRLDEVMKLKYGPNWQQKKAEVYFPNGEVIPFEILNGKPGQNNMMGALRAYFCAQELKGTLGYPASVSSKHKIPAGAAIGIRKLTEAEKIAFLAKKMSEEIELSPLATATILSENSDGKSSYGDEKALSDIVDYETARVIRPWNCDCIIAPGYKEEALEVLMKKKDGKMPILLIDLKYKPPADEYVEEGGIWFRCDRDTTSLGPETLENIVSNKKEFPQARKIDGTVAQIINRYTKSNTTVVAYDGHAIGVAAGMQSRIDSINSAGEKAQACLLRQMPQVLGLEFEKGMRSSDKIHAQLARIKSLVPLLKDEFLYQHPAYGQLVFSTDSFPPFADVPGAVKKLGGGYLIYPEGGERKLEVLAACDKLGLVVAWTKLRLFKEY